MRQKSLLDAFPKTHYDWILRNLPHYTKLIANPLGGPLQAFGYALEREYTAGKYPDLLEVMRDSHKFARIYPELAETWVALSNLGGIPLQADLSSLLTANDKEPDWWGDASAGVRANHCLVEAAALWDSEITMDTAVAGGYRLQRRMVEPELGEGTHGANNTMPENALEDDWSLASADTRHDSIDMCAVWELSVLMGFEKYGRNVFLVDSLVREMFENVDLSTVKADDLILPYPCMYVDVKNAPWALPDMENIAVEHRVIGFYIFETYWGLIFWVWAQTGDGGSGKFSKYYCEVVKEKVFSGRGGIESFFASLEDGELDTTKMCAVDDADGLRKKNRTMFEGVLRTAISLIFYLNSENSDVSVDVTSERRAKTILHKLEKVKSGKSKAKLERKLVKISRCRFFHVGRSEQKRLMRQPGFNINNVRTWRKGHPHRFWTGPVKDAETGDRIPYEAWPEKRKLIRKLLPATIINPDGEDRNIIRYHHGDGLSYDVKQRIIHDTLFPEGTPTRVEITRYERSKRARGKCFEYHGNYCAVCGLNPEEEYGEEFTDNLVAHHIIPVSQMGGGYKCDPISDMLPICATCHNAIHSKEPMYSVGELRCIWEEHHAGVVE